MTMAVLTAPIAQPSHGVSSVNSPIGSTAVLPISPQTVLSWNHEPGLPEDGDVLYGLYVPHARVFRREEIAKPVG